MTESLDDYRGRVLRDAEQTGKIIALTGAHSVTQPWCDEKDCERCHPQPAAEVLSVNILVRLAVTDAPECASWPDGRTHVPTEVAWSASYHNGRPWPVSVLATNGEGLTTHYGHLGDPIPDWVPRPPAGWDASLAVMS
jgi:hypothetical protein